MRYQREFLKYEDNFELIFGKYHKPFHAYGKFDKMLPEKLNMNKEQWRILISNYKHVSNITSVMYSF